MEVQAKLEKPITETDTATDDDTYASKRGMSLKHWKTTKTVTIVLLCICAVIFTLTNIILIAKVGEYIQQVEQFRAEVSNMSLHHSSKGSDTTFRDTHIMFSVGRARAFPQLSDSVIQMDVEIYNEEKYFNMDTNCFRAPVTGVYAFMFSAVNIRDGDVFISLRITESNHTTVITSASDYGRGSHYGGASGGAIIKVQKGETISLWSWGEQDGSYGIQEDMSAPSTMFSGFLVTPLE